MIRRLALLLLAALALVSPARADDSRPLYLSVTGEGGGRFAVEWKIPVTLEPVIAPDIVPPQSCTGVESRRRWSDTLGHWQSAEWTCPQGLEGGTIAIAYPRANPALATIARLRLEGGAGPERTVLLLPQQDTLTLEATETVTRTPLFDYIKLGVEHIWLGFDHLLFVAGLIFIAGSLRRVLATITGFTLAHSVTLALSALDMVRLPIRAVEAVIALSIVFLAVEIARGKRDSLTWRYPVAVAASFGLLHGFGFAAVLREIGLPESNYVAALLGFNVGIELGQIAFAAIVMALIAALHWLGQHRGLPGTPAGAQRLAAYAVGTLASFWTLQRLFT